MLKTLLKIMFFEIYTDKTTLRVIRRLGGGKVQRTTTHRHHSHYHNHLDPEADLDPGPELDTGPDPDLGPDPGPDPGPGLPTVDLTLILVLISWHARCNFSTIPTSRNSRYLHRYYLTSNVFILT